MSTILEHEDGVVHIDELDNGKRRITVELKNPSAHLPCSTWDTEYSIELIEAMLRIKSPDYLCDEIRRDEDDVYVSATAKNAVIAHVDEKTLVGKRILDFGCGSGASTTVLSRLFPDTSIVGVDLLPHLIDVARAKAEHFNMKNVEFYVSPGGDKMPEDLGEFDCVFLSGVYEHLLPHERMAVLPQIWSVLKPGGILFIFQTPNRRFFVETHSTSIPLLNYMPDRMAYWFTRRFSKRTTPGSSWERLLRAGIRGATPEEIIGILNKSSKGEAELLQPCREGFHDDIDVWAADCSGDRAPRAKCILIRILRALKCVYKRTMVPSLSIAIRKKNSGC